MYDGTDIDGFHLCLIPARRAESLCSAWSRVAARALVPDPFVHPLWLAAAARHDNSLRDLQILTVWRDDTLCGLLPLRATTGFMTRGWQIPHLHPAASGAPFLLADEAEATFAAACALLRTHGTTLHVDLAQTETPFVSLIRSESTRLGLQLREGPLRQPAPSGLARQRSTRPRATEMTSSFTFQRSTEPAALRAGVEHLLDCDARAAARDGRPALLQDVGTVNLLRTASRGLASDRSCQLGLLRDGQSDTVLAAMLVLFAHGRAVVWHEAVDPDHPGAGAVLRERLGAALARRRDKPVLHAATDGVQAQRSYHLRLRVPGNGFFVGFAPRRASSQYPGDASQFSRLQDRAVGGLGETVRPSGIRAPSPRRVS